jgi:hypothetical protein
MRTKIVKNTLSEETTSARTPKGNGSNAIDSTRIAASVCGDRVDTEQALRSTRAQLRRQVRVGQKAADRDDAGPGGLEVAIGELNQALDSCRAGWSG